MEVDSGDSLAPIANGEEEEDLDGGLPPLLSNEDDDADDGDVPMPERSTSPKQHVRANRQRKGESALPVHLCGREGQRRK